MPAICPVLLQTKGRVRVAGGAHPLRDVRDFFLRLQVDVEQLVESMNCICISRRQFDLAGLQVAQQLADGRHPSVFGGGTGRAASMKRTTVSFKEVTIR